MMSNLHPQRHSSRPSTRAWLTSALAAAALGTVLLPALGSPSPETPDPRPPKTEAPTVAPTWKNVDQLIAEDKHQAAKELVEQILTDASAAGDTDDWTRALIRRLQLETALHGYQTAVVELRAAPWPDDAVARVALELVYANALTTYERAYAWEIRQRERVAADDQVDLERWTSTQIRAEADRAFARLWEQRGQWGEQSLGALAEYISQNDYPARIRGTLRDTVSYLWVDLLADTGAWSAAQQSVWALDLEALIAGAPELEAIWAEGDSLHPLERIAAILGDLERWHQEGDRTEAALEAFLERIRRLRGSFNQSFDQATLTEALRERIDSTPRSLPWWSMATAELATAVQGEPEPDALIRARELALDGERAHPDSPGGRRCRHLVAGIETPSYSLQAMASDGLERDSIAIQHANLETLHFRAVKLDPEKLIVGADDWSWLPQWQEAAKLLRSGSDHVTWRVELPATPDYRSHRTLATPRVPGPGLWLVGASARQDFRDDSNQLVAVAMVVGDPVLEVAQQQGSTSWEVTVRSGRSGEPLAEADVIVVRLDWRGGHRIVSRTRTDATGRIELAAGDWSQNHLVLARHQGEIAIDFQQLNRLWGAQREPDSGALIYTDRAVYRPGQKVLWKVVAWNRDPKAGTITVAADLPLEVTLEDANAEEVETVQVRTNQWGSASGEFTAQPGKLLGEWTISTSTDDETEILVEEYKRPTFEVTLEEPENALRLNRDAELSGEARYYFGLPVTGASARWRVTRELVRPWWWWWSPPTAGGPEVIAAGEADLDQDGRFTVAFVPRADERRAGEKGISWRFRLEADVTDAGGETRTASRGVRLGFVTVEGRVELPGGFVAAGDEIELEARRSDLDGTPRAGAASWALLALDQPEQTPLPVEVPRAIEPQEGAFQTPGDLRRARWEGETRPATILAGWPDGPRVAGGDLAHGADGLATLKLPALEPGAYRVRYTTTDPFGATFEVAQELLVAADDRGMLSLPLVLALEQGTVEVGGTARALVHSGFAGQPIRLELFRGGARRWQRDLESNGHPQVVEIPIERGDRGGFSLRASTLRDHQSMVATENVTVPWSDRELQVRFASFRDTLRPGTKETWRVEVVDPNEGELASAELLASMYDRSLDLIAPYSPPRALALFPSWFGVGGLRTSLGIAQQVWWAGNGLASLPGYPTFQDDRVKVLDGYGIGGPGRRFRGGAMQKMSAMAPAPTLAPQDAIIAEAVVVSDEARLESDGQELAVRSVDPPASEGSVELRTDFAETALWQPHLRLGDDGSAAIEVELPDSVTEWSVWVHALTKDFRSGSIEKRARTVKELMVRPSLPRFLREGDRLTVEILVDNAGETPLDATVTVALEDAESGESLASEFGIAPEVGAGRSVHIEPGRTATVPVSLVVPARLGTVAVRAIARAGDLSDGELRPLPVLPGRMHLSQSRFAALRDAASRTLRFADLAADDDPTRIDEQLVVTVDAQLMTSVLKALPYLVEYPYECTEQTLNRFLSTGIVTSVFRDHPALAELGKRLAADRETIWESFDAADPNRRMELEETPWLRQSRGENGADHALLRVLDPDVAAAHQRDALAKLLASQTSSGAWPWFPGGPPSPWITLYIVDSFSRAVEFQVEVPKEPIVRAWQYLHRYYVDELVRGAISQDCCWEMVTYLGYVLSAYPDESWTGGVFSEGDRRTMLDFSWKHWRQHSPRLKAYLALTLHRADRAADAKLVLDSIMDSARTDEDLGTYWAREDKSWLWYQDTVESHAFILRTMSELAPDDPRRDGLIQWLFLEKKLSHWKSTRATAEAIYALAYALERDGRLGVREVVEIAAGPRHATFTFEPSDPVTKQQLVIEGEEVTPAMGSIDVSKETKGFAFASATWHFSTERLPEEGDGDLLAVERSYYKRSLSGSEWILEPLADGVQLEPGDEVEVQLEVTARHAAEYVHLRDPRPAGFEPVGLRSGWTWDLGIAWYEEIRDSGTNFFFERLPTGSYTLKHRITVRQAGVFRVAPATLQSMYAPEFTAYSAGRIVTVGE